MSSKISIKTRNLKSSIRRFRDNVDVFTGKTVDRIDQSCKNVIKLTEKHFYITLIVCTLISIAFRLLILDFFPANSDLLVYIAKAREILDGDFRPVLPYEIGWPIVISMLSALFGASTTTEITLVANVSSIIFASSTIIPVALSTRSLFNTRTAIIVTFMMMFWAMPPEMSPPGLSEGFFMFLLCTSFYFIVKSRDNWRWMFIANVVLGYAAIMKINGIILPIASFIGFAFARRSRFSLNDISRFAISTVPFFFFIGINWISRTMAFGSPFFYGANSNLFLDGGTDVMWAPNITEFPTFFDYVTSHSIIEISDRLFMGSARLVLNFFTVAIPAVIVLPFITGTLKNLMSKKRFITIFFVSILLPNVLFFDSFSPTRYLIVVIPIVMMIASSGLVNMLKHVKIDKKHSVAIATVLGVIFLSMFTTIRSAKTSSLNSVSYARAIGMINEAKSTWVAWGSSNLHDSYIMTEDGCANMIVGAFEDAEPMHANDGIYFKSESANISISFAVYYYHIDDAYNWMKNNGVTHYIEFGSNQNIPWASAISTDSRFSPVYSVDGTYDSVTIYQII